MKITITSADIEKMSRMNAEERVIYLETKMVELKNEQLSWMGAGFSAAFGLA
jgi:hypothetical protein